MSGRGDPEPVALSRKGSHGGRSKTRKGMLCWCREWARRSLEIPAPRMRIGKRDGGVMVLGCDVGMVWYV